MGGGGLEVVTIIPSRLVEALEKYVFVDGERFERYNQGGFRILCYLLLFNRCLKSCNVALHYRLGV